MSKSFSLVDDAREWPNFFEEPPIKSFQDVYEDIDM